MIYALGILGFGGVLFIGATGYIIVTATQRVRDAGKWSSLPLWVRAIAGFWGVFGIIADFVINRTYATIRFREPPHRDERLLTDRLKRYRKLASTDQRKRIALKEWSWLNDYQRGHW